MKILNKRKPKHIYTKNANFKLKLLRVVPKSMLFVVLRKLLAKPKKKK